ncbi:MAG: hypothetical protein SV775_17555, partial [Thermodesulfobacteriota bacterium]|nr:hypothetical protein [Thermodesulfobacteriota bacterium]
DDDPEIDSIIEEWRDRGYDYFMKAGLKERNKGDFPRSLKFFESADFLRPDLDSRRELERAEKYVEADKHYVKSKDLQANGRILEAMEALIKARQTMPEHYKVSQLMIQSMSAWTAATFKIGKQFVDAGQTDDAFRAFNALHQFNPGYSNVEDYYEKTKSAYLKQHYISLVDAQNAREIPQIVAYSQNITEVEPDFLDTREIMTRAFLKAFNRFYQRGHHYVATGNYGKAILCFRSAEQQLAKTRLTQDLIEEAWEQITKTSVLKLVFWNFFQEIRDTGIGQYTTDKLKTLMKNRMENKRFKNIILGFETLQENGTISEVNMSKDIDWGPILSRGYNGVITGYINSLKLDKSLTSEWKIRKRMVKKIIDNEEYTKLLMRKAELNRALTSKRDRGNLSKGRIKDELERIEESIPAVPPKIEAEVAEETPYEVQTHTMTAYLQIDIQIIASDGSYVWPLKRYEETFQVKDMVIPPDLKSEDPNERKGDPLVLPSESKFKEQAIDYILEDKVIPDMLERFDDYGMRFYLKADELSKSNDELRSDPTAFLDSIEEYYKFLACYNGKDDTLPEEVRNTIDEHISALWLMGDKGADR